MPDTAIAIIRPGLTRLPDLMLRPLVEAALLEDLGRAGDLTSESTIPVNAISALVLRARDHGVVAGLDLARLAFAAISSDIVLTIVRDDGTVVAPGDVIARVTGPARAILTAERVALNFLCHLSGVATATHTIARSIAHTKARVCDTRKTTPGLRAVQKYAVRAGGGMNHRFGLDDAVLIKDNHIAIAGGIEAAVRGARACIGHLVKIEVEVDTLAQLDIALALGVDAVLLDNMNIDTLRQAVAMIGDRAIAEASGRVTPQTAAAIAETGVDLISVGWLTHSAPVFDIGLDAAESWA